MNNNLPSLQERISQLKKKKKSYTSSSGQGYNVSIVMMTDLISCVIVGLAIGLFFQKVFHTSILLTACLTLLGGMAGFYTVIRFALAEEKKTK